MATAVYSTTRFESKAVPASTFAVSPLSKARVRALENEPLLDRCELLYEACLAAQGTSEIDWLRQQLDMAVAEATRRKLIRWQL